MKADNNPRIRRDLEFFPILHGNDQLIVIRDHLGLVEDGKAVALPLYQLMTLLDGTNTVRDIQMILMRQRGGVLVGTEEIDHLMADLDKSYLLETERYAQAKEKVVAEFAAKNVRYCSHCGSSYPDQATDLKKYLDEIINTQPSLSDQKGIVKALIAPHIDLSVGKRAYGGAYRWFKHVSPSRVVLLGVGHKMMGDLFSLTEKDFETPLGKVKNNRCLVRKLREAGRSIVADNDFVHKAEHSLEFQVIFLQHLLAQDSFSIIPILCGPIMTSISGCTRKNYLEKATPFLKVLSEILNEEGEETLLVAGVDLSHIGPKFGHDMPATHLESQSEKHDQILLKAVSECEADEFWEESIRVEDRFNVCGFSAMACLLEVIPPSKGRVLNYRCWHEEATRSAVSFASVVFLKNP